MLMDLIDFTNKPGRSGTVHYILAVIDNFSHYMMTVALTDKTAAKTVVGLRKVLDKVKSGFGNPKQNGMVERSTVDSNGKLKIIVNK